MTTTQEKTRDLYGFITITGNPLKFYSNRPTDQENGEKLIPARVSAVNKKT